MKNTQKPVSLPLANVCWAVLDNETEREQELFVFFFEGHLKPFRSFSLALVNNLKEIKVH